jgi:glyoxylase-like metal-dependent hydrolase (beta-lactamase superfamily II)
MGLGPALVPTVDSPLGAGDLFHIGAQAVSVRYTPGHAPGHVTLVVPSVPLAEGSADLAFCGDVIFAGSIGRTDLEGGDYELLMSVIDTEILTLAPETVLLSGHGPRTTVASEAETNPFVLQWRRSR